MDVINEKYFLEPEDKPEYHSNKRYTEISKSVSEIFPAYCETVSYTDLLIPLILVIVIISTI